VDLSKENILIKSNSSINVSTGFLSIQAKDTLIHSEVKIVGNIVMSGDLNSNNIKTGHVTSASVSVAGGLSSNNINTGNITTGHITSSSASGHYPR
jgi:phage baseplate assembly protein gpV